MRNSRFSSTQLSAGELIDELVVALRTSGIADPRRIAADILSALLRVNRAWPCLNGDVAIAPDTAARARHAAKQLDRGVPFAYAVQYAQFRHLDLHVDDRVLIPRPETEGLVDVVLPRMHALYGAAKAGIALDLGTGSGALALSLALEGNFERVVGTDTSRGALDVARTNAADAQGLRCAVEFRLGSWFAPVADIRANLIVSNPPYIAYDEARTLPQSVRDWEPATALFSPESGLGATRRIVSGAPDHLCSGGILALEVDARRASLVAELLMSNAQYREVTVALDLAGRERYVLATRT